MARKRRFKGGEIPTYDQEAVVGGINKLSEEYEKKDKGFWSGSGDKHIHRARIIQRATCYQDALKDMELLPEGVLGRLSKMSCLLYTSPSPRD